MMVLRSSAVAPLPTKRPPPVPEALLAEPTRLLVMVTEVRVTWPLASMPPPRFGAMLPLIVLFVTMSVSALPLLVMPPAGRALEVLLPLIVLFVTVSAEFETKIPTWPLPLMVLFVTVILVGNRGVDDADPVIPR